MYIADLATLPGLEQGKKSPPGLNWQAVAHTAFRQLLRRAGKDRK